MKTTRGLIPILLIVLGLGAVTGCRDGAAPAAPTDGAVPPATDTTPMTGVEKAYLEFALNHLETVAEDLATLEFLFSNPDTEDEHWKASVTVLLNRIELAHASMALLEPTERLQPFQAAGTSALEHAAAFTTALRDMLAAGTTTLSDEAAEAYVQTSVGFDEVDRLLAEFLAAHPAPEESKDPAAAAS